MQRKSAPDLGEQSLDACDGCLDFEDILGRLDEEKIHSATAARSCRGVFEAGATGCAKRADLIIDELNLARRLAIHQDGARRGQPSRETESEPVGIVSVLIMSRCRTPRAESLCVGVSAEVFDALSEDDVCFTLEVSDSGYIRYWPKPIGSS